MPAKAWQRPQLITLLDCSQKGTRSLRDNLSRAAEPPKLSDSTPEKHAGLCNSRWSPEAPRQGPSLHYSLHCSPSRRSTRQLGPGSKGKWGKARCGSRSGLDQSMGYRWYGGETRGDRQDTEGRSRCMVGRGGWDMRSRELHKRDRPCRNRWEGDKQDRD